jgi:type I restriction enzyme S subunit
MIDGLKPYTDYQESGAHWLGQVPKHWSVMPNRAIFEEVKDRDHPKEEMLSVTITRGIVRQRALLAHTSKKDSSNQNKSAYKLVQPNDIAYNKMRAWQGAIGVSDLRGIISPAYVVMRLRSSQVPRYLHYLYRTPQFAKEAERWSYGITSDMWSLRPEHFKMIYAALPPRDEQAAIVKFLDYANGKIERAIRAKRKLIGLLNEQKQAIIHRAVTRGLDPNVKLKPSGIPWLGDVPEHWDIRPIKQTLLRMDYGTSESSTGDGTYRVLTMGHIQDGRVRVPDEGGINQIPAGLALQSNDLLFNRTNSPELVGKVGIFTGSDEPPVTFASYLVRLRVRSEHNPSWLNHLLNSFRFWAFARSQALVSLHQANLNSSRYGRMSIPVPTRSDQDAIVEYIHEHTSTIDTVIARTEREIILMQEYRTTLTAEVVTGKLDVREAVKRLPAETEEPLRLDDLVDDEIHAEAEA